MLDRKNSLLVFFLLFTGMNAERIGAQDPGDSVPQDSVRTWTTQSGKFETKATFLKVVDGNVKLKLASSGSEITVPLSRLSTADQNWVADRLKKVELPNNGSPKADPSKTDPSKTEPPKTEPPKTDPSKTDPSKTDPSKTDPSKTDPSKTDPSKTDPSKTDPSKTDPPKTDPPKTDPPKTDPSKTDPSKTDPSKTDPPKTEPPKTEPPKTEPPKTEPPKKNFPTATDLQLNAQLKLSELIRFDEDNKPKSRPFELVIDAVGATAKDAIEIGWVKLNSANAPDGTEVGKVDSISDFFDLSNKFKRITDRGTDFFALHPMDGVRVRLEIERSNHDWKKLTNTSGSFRIKSGGDRKVIKHEEAPLNLGTIESDELKSRGMSAVVSKIGVDTLTVQLTGIDLSTVYRVAILSPEQKKLNALLASSWGRQEDGVTYSFSFSPSAPADATVFIFIAENLQEFEIPFEFPELELKR